MTQEEYIKRLEGQYESMKKIAVEAIEKLKESNKEIKELLLKERNIS